MATLLGDEKMEIFQGVSEGQQLQDPRAAQIDGPIMLAPEPLICMPKSLFALHFVKDTVVPGCTLLNSVFLIQAP
jgi:hypothetical protein